MNREDRMHDATDSVITECDLTEPPEKVWRALTVPELLAAWLMPNDIRPEVGCRFTFQAEPGGGDGVIECEVLAAEPHRLLRYSWRGGETERDAGDRTLDTVVTFQLTETRTGGTHLRVVHSGFPLSLGSPVVRLAMLLSASLPAAPVWRHPRDQQVRQQRPFLAAYPKRRAA